ncbi:multiple sugar transport system permease protein [Microbacterium ginsengiterrae]|uniref:Multiple sugar transport system permease protein n=1 Tax=Microbacterium ginsengiterrae TaxID=546115 RepID=A0A7W9FB72_9MICO|nr:carbohydrate ABC transporter permease [Microbacterium ginsengiterrae]MBB5742991.1 multiple sugar transport system permease protein [Microbacterium ginsengiterrae]
MTITTRAPRTASDDAMPPKPPAPAKRPPRRRRGRGRGRIALRHILLTLFALLMLYPLLWMIVSSFKPSNLILSQVGLIPTEVTVDNYTDGWTALGVPFTVFLVNSGIIAVGSIIGNLFSCSLTAYALARLNFRGNKLYFGLALMTIMLPFHVLIIPQYIMFAEFGWINTYAPLLVPKFLATDAVFIFLMVQFIRSIPRELDQAAMIDGAGPFRIFWAVILPLMQPALITTTIFTFIWTWNDYFGPLLYLTKTPLYTTPVALKSLVDTETQSGMGIMFAMSLISLIPILLFFIFAQKHIIKGISTTGIK